MQFFAANSLSGAVLSVCLLSLGCEKRQGTASATATDTRAKESSPAARNQATWLHHPLTKLPVTAALELSSGEMLEVDASGNRWLTGSNDAQASAFGAPEALSGIMREGEEYVAVGQSGTLYFFSEPLGPFIHSRTPASPFMKTRLVGDVLISISGQGELFRSSDHGRHFKRANAAGFFVDFGVSENDSVFAVATPETWYQSFDRGDHFEVASLSSIAPLEMTTGSDGRLVIHGLFGEVSPVAGGWVKATGSSGVRPAQALSHFARVSAIGAQTALLDEDGYFSLHPTKSDETFRAERGSIDEKLTSTVIPRPADCSTFRVAGPSASPLLICKGDAVTVAPLIRMLRWDRKKQTWNTLKPVLRGPFEGLRVVQSTRDDVVLSGACGPHTSEQGCSPHGLIWMQGDKKLSFLQLPSEGALLDFDFDLNGQLWALLQRSKDNHLLLIGPIFEPLSTSEPRSTLGSIPNLLDVTRIAPEIAVDAKQQAKLLLKDAGLVSIVVERFGSLYIAQLNSDGRLLSSLQAPVGTSLLHGTGRRLSALDVKRNLYWGSESGGLSWTKHPLPSELCSDEPCSPQLRCTSRGCLVGDELVRVGYLGSAHGSVSTPLALGVDERQPLSLDRVVCRLNDDVQTVAGLSSIPTAHEALLGKSLWSGVRMNSELATATVVHVPKDQSNIVERTLFSRGPSSQAYALQLFPQIEGNAALRYPVFPGTQDLAGPIELAWDNRILDVTERVTIGLGVPGPGAEVRLDERLQPSLMSVAARGLFFQAGQEKAQSPFYFPGNGAPAEPIQEPVWPGLDSKHLDKQLLQQLARGARTERVVVDEERGALLLLANNRIVVRRGDGGSGEEVAYLMGGLESIGNEVRHAVHLSYRGSRIGFTSVQLDLEGDQRQAQFVELGKGQTFLPPVSVALQRHLPNRPHICDEVQMNSMPRVVANKPRNQTRQVEVLGIEGESLLLATQDAIVFGTPDAPCLGIWEATALQDSDEGHFSALVVPGKAGGSWLFRVEPTNSASAQINAQPMSCSFE